MGSKRAPSFRAVWLMRPSSASCLRKVDRLLPTSRNSLGGMIFSREKSRLMFASVRLFSLVPVIPDIVNRPKDAIWYVDNRRLRRKQHELN